MRITQEERSLLEKRARYKALRDFMSTNPCFERFHTRRADQRTIFGREYNRYRAILDNDTAMTEKRKEAMRKRIERFNNRWQFSNILTNKIVMDYMVHKNEHFFEVHADRLVEGRRNHWAKNDFDKKILSILMKYRQ